MTTPAIRTIHEAMAASGPKRRYGCPGGDCLDLRCWATGRVDLPNEVNGFSLGSREGTPLQIAHSEDLTVPAESKDYENRFLCDPTQAAYPQIYLPRPADRIEVEVVSYIGTHGRTLSLGVMETGNPITRPVPLLVKAMGVPQNFVVTGRGILAIAFAGKDWVEAGIMRICIA